MRHAVESVLAGGEDVEVLIIDDGSTDDTAKIADEMEEEHPGIIRAIHQENGGHGEASTQDSGMPRAFIIRS